MKGRLEEEKDKKERRRKRVRRRKKMEKAKRQTDRQRERGLYGQKGGREIKREKGTGKSKENS